VILTGAGEKAFCTGIDRAESIEQGYLVDEERRLKMANWIGPVSTPFQYNDPGININPKENDFWKPVIAAVKAWPAVGRSTSWANPTSSSRPSTRRSSTPM
jgi:enoyl-CoA hydratase/carnithine racemase